MLVFLAGTLPAADKGDKNNKKSHKATITKVDRQKGTVTVRMKDKNGKEHERTFRLTGEIRYFDSTGRVAAADIFSSGDEVLVVEEEGHLKEIHKHNKGAGRTTKDKK
jgi:hypothetical protein